MSQRHIILLTHWDDSVEEIFIPEPTKEDKKRLWELWQTKDAIFSIGGHVIHLEDLQKVEWKVHETTNRNTDQAEKIQAPTLSMESY